MQDHKVPRRGHWQGAHLALRIDQRHAPHQGGRHIVRMTRPTRHRFAIQGEGQQLVAAHACLGQRIDAHHSRNSRSRAGPNAASWQNGLGHRHFHAEGVAQGAQQRRGCLSSDVGFDLQRQCGVGAVDQMNARLGHPAKFHEFSGGLQGTSQGVKPHIEVGHRGWGPNAAERRCVVHRVAANLMMSAKTPIAVTSAPAPAP